VSTSAISVRAVSKRYRLYHERNQSLKATVLRGRRAKYEEFWALRDVTLEVAEGSTFALIGENGSGKTTLLKCMARILRPDGGTLETRGKISALLELGAGFHPELSGRDNVYLNGSILGLTKKEIRHRFDDIVGFAGLEHFIDSPVKNYSSGMYVRLGFSVAINVDPDILLVDEILAVGDIEFQRRCLEKVVDLKSRGKTIVIVSHSLESVRNLCDNAALLEHGALRRSGPASAVVDEYYGDSQTDRVADGASGSRWGSGQGRIENVELLDADGVPSKRVRTGEPVTFRLHYSTREPIERPVFGMALYSIDGVHLSGPNTREADLVPDRIDGTGTVDLRVDRLLLLPGTYDLSGTLYDYTLSHAYDHRHRAFRFDVEAGKPQEHHGIVSLGGTWEGPVVASSIRASLRSEPA
jgi:ABC-type polysaccharide/polyol phosphate transport system ATPase subunit